MNLKIPQATSKGYIEVKPYGAFDWSYPDSLTRRGRVQGDGGDIALRIFPDVHVKGGNINLKRAKELTGNQNLTEQEMVDMAAELIDKAGVKVSVKAVAQLKFTELLEKEGYQLHRKGIVTKSFDSNENENENENTGGDNQGGTQGNNDNINPGGNGGNNGGVEEG